MWRSAATHIARQCPVERRAPARQPREHLLEAASTPVSPIASYYSENIAQLIAASVAARGVLFGNAHGTPSRYLDRQHYFIWQSLRDFLFFLFTMICPKQVAYNPEPEALAN